jgi:hypothetical protein
VLQYSGDPSRRPTQAARWSAKVKRGGGIASLGQLSSRSLNGCNKLYKQSNRQARDVGVDVEVFSGLTIHLDRSRRECVPPGSLSNLLRNINRAGVSFYRSSVAATDQPEPSVSFASAAVRHRTPQQTNV